VEFRSAAAKVRVIMWLFYTVNTPYASLTHIVSQLALFTNVIDTDHVINRDYQDQWDTRSWSGG
jgi:hypothetical protein